MPKTAKKVEELKSSMNVPILSQNFLLIDFVIPNMFDSYFAGVLCELPANACFRGSRGDRYASTKIYLYVFGNAKILPSLPFFAQVCFMFRGLNGSIMFQICTQ